MLFPLTSLDLNKNSITGTIPSELGMLSSSIYFHLGQNDITGTIIILFAYLVLPLWRQRILRQNYGAIYNILLSTIAGEIIAYKMTYD